MITVIQRVGWARILIDQQLHAEIGPGILALVGIEKTDNAGHADKLLERILSLRIFADAQGKMNLDVKQAGGGLLLVSQFTLVASTDRGLRPGFSSAMPPAEARTLFDHLVARAQRLHQPVQSGLFGADMQVQLENDGPVTFTLAT